MLRVGLTGGIATGKSTVGLMLAELGACVVDADRLVHELLAAGGAAVPEVVERFGPEVLDGAGGVDRPTLGRIVFSDADARERLERILHPKVREHAEDRFARAAREQGCRIAVLDAALLVETGQYRDFDRLIVVRCSPATQRRRLRRRDGIDESEAEKRIAIQLPLEAKIELADDVIDTDGTIDATRAQVRRLHEKLERDYEQRFAGD